MTTSKTREEMAAKILSGMLSNSSVSILGNMTDKDADSYVDDAVLLTDKLLLKLQQTENGKS